MGDSVLSTLKDTEKCCGTHVQLDPPYESEQVVEKFSDLLGAGVAVDRIAIGGVPDHKSSSFGFLQITGPTGSFHYAQNGVHTKAYLQQKVGEMEGGKRRAALKEIIAVVPTRHGV